VAADLAPVLAAAVRAPSAHNAQPWRLEATGDDAYDVAYAHADRLLADPDDRDGLLAIGAFIETMALAAEHRGLTLTFAPGVVERGDRLVLGRLALAPLDREPDPLAAAVERRVTNRHPYDRSPLPPGLRDRLAELGCAFVDPRAVVPLVRRASVMAWKDRRFIRDLRDWTRFDDAADDGLTCDCLELSWLDRQALRGALAAGRLPTPIAHAFATRDVRMTRASSAVAVLGVTSRDSLELVECGGRLLRAWVTLTAAGWSYHPISIVIDQPTALELPALCGLADPVAIFRVGYTAEAPTPSRRRGMDRTLTT